MSDSEVRSQTEGSVSRSRRGQSFVEFALVLPLLLVLLLGIADFGRVFHAGIVTESAARAAAETVALEYARKPPPALPADDSYYQRLHLVAAETVCSELRLLPNTTYTEAGSPPTTQCLSWPAVATCIHDGHDTRCTGAPASSDFTAGPAECSQMSSGWSPTTDSQGHAYVEVRVCYQFTTLFDLVISLPMNAGLSLGDVFLQKEAFFTVADY